MTEAYFKVTKQLGRELGWEAAVLYAHLKHLSETFFGGKAFYQQQSRICKDLGLSKHKIITLTQKLIEKELIEVQEHPGMKNRYRILTGKESLPLVNKTRKRKTDEESGKESLPLLEETGKESLPLAVKNLYREDKELIDEKLSDQDEKQKDPSQFVTHERETEPETYLARWAKGLNIE